MQSLPRNEAQADLLRRGLLGLITALIVARPMVLGEDPGLIDKLSSVSGLALSVLWFAAAFGWGIWRAWSGRASWRSSAVELALAAVALLVFASALGRDRYRHPATLIACEWVVLLLAFCLVRQLARTPGENQSLLAAIVATGVSLSIYAIYQYHVELPEVRKNYSADTQALREAMGPELASDESTVEHMRRRILEDNIFATYAHPNSFAGYLALLLPASVAWAVTGSRLRSRRWQGLLLGAATLLIFWALWLTHSRGAILASLLVAGTVLLLRLHHLWWQRRAWVIGGVLLLVGAVFLAGKTEWGALGLQKAVRSFGLRTGYWSASWSMIRDHPWRGVGPVNFGRHYPRHMLASASEKVQDPHNFALEVWATSGVFALLALLAVLVLFYRHAWPSFLGSFGSASGDEQDKAPEERSIRWEFYLGGMAGIILALLLRAVDQPAGAIVYEGFLSAGRALVWFAVFILLDNVYLGRTARSLAITAGVTALLLNLLVSGGIAFPSVAQPLWVMAALAINVLDEGVYTQRRSALWFQSVLPLPVLAGAAVAYILLVFYPVVSSYAAQTEARGYAAEFERSFRPDLQQRSTNKRGNARALQAGPYVAEHIIKPLESAVGEDPGDVHPRLELANWYMEQAGLFPDLRFPKLARDQLAAVQRLDPYGKEGYLAAYRLSLTVAQRSKGDRDAAAALEHAVECDPTEARLRYRLAEAWFNADDPVRGRRHAAVAGELDQLATVPERHLTDEQRGQIEQWLRDRPAK